MALPALTIIPVAAAVGDPLTSLFEPLRGVDVARFYELNHPWIDFVIFLFLFTAVGQYSLSRRLGGRAGQLLSIVIGLVLALALSLTQRSLGFSLKSFGPLAAGVIIFLVGLAVFHLIRGLGLGLSGAGSLAFLVTYFLIRATTPNFFAWLETNEQTAWIHLLLAIAVIISLWRVLRIIWSERRGGSVISARSPNPAGPGENLDRIKQDQLELKTIDQELEGPTQQELKEDQVSLDELNEAIQLFDRHRHDPAEMMALADRLASLEVRRDSGQKQLARLKTLSRRIEKADLRSFRLLANRLRKMSPQERDKARRRLALAKRKIISEDELVGLEEKVNHQIKSRSAFIRKAISQLRRNRPDQARALLTRALEQEKRAVTILTEMKNKEEALLNLVKVGLQTDRDQK